MRAKKLPDFEPPAAAPTELGIGPDHDLAVEDGSGVQQRAALREWQVVPNVIVGCEGLARCIGSVIEQPVTSLREEDDIACLLRRLG